VLEERQGEKPQAPEQHHRAIKRCCASMAGCKPVTNAAITISGIALAHRMQKRQFSFG
jgi:transposase-like protein